MTRLLPTTRDMTSIGLDRPAPGRAAAAGSLGVALAFALAAVWAVHAVLDPLAGLGVDPVLVVGEGGMLAVCAAVTAAAAFRGARAERRAWALIATGLGLSAAGTLAAHLRAATPADAEITAWELLRVVSYAPLLAGFAGLVSERLPHRRIGLWVDGAITALCVQAVLGAVWLDDLVAVAAAGDIRPDAQLTAFVLLALDLVLLGAATGAIAHAGWKLAAWAPLAGAALGIAASDSVYLSRLAAGDWVPGQLWDAGWVLAALLIAIAAWSRPAPVAPLRAGARASVPAALALVAIALVVVAAVSDVPRPVTLAAGAASVVMAVLRLVLSQRENDRLLAAAERHAFDDPLTGLRNRRGLEADLADACRRGAGEGAGAVLVLVDLDHFKPYNDRYGHLAGDDLLQDVARDLRRRAAGGRAYRIGGDEFCLLVPAGRFAAGEIAGAVGPVRFSAGHARIPQEATSPAEALGLADRRMYADKWGGRRAAPSVAAGPDRRRGPRAASS